MKSCGARLAVGNPETILTCTRKKNHKDGHALDLYPRTRLWWYTKGTGK